MATLLPFIGGIWWVVIPIALLVAHIFILRDIRKRNGSNPPVPIESDRKLLYWSVSGLLAVTFAGITFAGLFIVGIILYPPSY